MEFVTPSFNLDGVFNMSQREIASMNGKIFDLKDAKISVLDHCFLYGDGVFEGIRLINRKILLHKEHMERLYNSARAMRIPMVSKPEYEKQLFKAIKASKFNFGYLRVVLTRGIGDLGINPLKCLNPQLIIIVTSLRLYPKELYEKGLKVIIAKTKKIPNTCLDFRVKSCNYLNNVMAAWEYTRKADEAIMTDDHGIVSEATLDNIFGIKGNTLFTPSQETNCLSGVTRIKIMDLARGQGMKVIEGKYRVGKFVSADEVFLTGTAAGIVPVTRIEKHKIGNGKIGSRTKKLRDEYESRIEEFCTSIKN